MQRSEGRIEAAPGGGDGRQELPSDPWAGTRTKRRKWGGAPEGHRRRKTTEGQRRAAERILGRWRIEGSEPCRVCEEGEEWIGSRNLPERRVGMDDHIISH